MNLDTRFISDDDPLTLNFTSKSSSQLEPINLEYGYESVLLLKESLANDAANSASCLNIRDPLEQLYQDEAYTNNTFPPVFAQLPDNTWALYDQRLNLNENTIDNPLMDGGGNNVKNSVPSRAGEVSATICNNAPPTIFNMESCKLSTEENVCQAVNNADYTSMELERANMVELNDARKADTGVAGVVCEIIDIPRDLDNTPVCNARSISRWIKKNLTVSDNEVTCRASSANVTIEDSTHSALAAAIFDSRDENDYTKDVMFKGTCASSDSEKIGMSVYVAEEQLCYQNVHPLER